MGVTNQSHNEMMDRRLARARVRAVCKQRPGVLSLIGAQHKRKSGSAAEIRGDTSQMRSAADAGTPRAIATLIRAQILPKLMKLSQGDTPGFIRLGCRVE